MGDLTNLKEEILEILDEGIASSQTIIGQTESPKSQVYKALKELRDENKIKQLPNLRDTRKYFYAKVI